MAIAAIASKTIKILDEKSGITFYGVGDVRRIWGKRPPDSERASWKNVITDFQPDCIMVWGTEFANGLSVLDVAGSIPVLFFIQGVLGRIANYPLGLLGNTELFRYTGVIGLLKSFHFKLNNRKQKKQARLEAEMVRCSSGIVLDNEWAASYYRNVAPQTRLYRCALPVNRIFWEERYEEKVRVPHTIFAIDGSNPAKGIFNLICAIALVKRSFPDVRLYIPGAISSRKPTILFESPYYTYLKRLIKKFQLAENVEFCGRLSPEQMKEKIDSCAVFVMPSCVENHSSSLREAMYCGAPCISALVGSVDEFTSFGKDALTYRYNEYDVLAAHISSLFSDEKYAQEIGKEAWHSIRRHFPQDNICDVMVKLYREVIDR